MKIQRWWRSSSSLQRHRRQLLWLAAEMGKRGGDNIDWNDKAMETSYWLEAADRKHRYGSRLKPYYQEWLASGTNLHFFQWLDEGPGKDLDLPNMPRRKLRQSRVRYLTESECAEFEVEFVQEDESDEVLLCWKRDSSDGHHLAGEEIDAPSKCCLFYRLGIPMDYIYVVDMQYRLFVHEKEKGIFHHSSFLSGKAVRAAGGIVIKEGTLIAVNGNSGHYKPSARMLHNVFQLYEDEHGLDKDSYMLVEPRTRKLCGSCTPSFLCFKKLPTIPTNFPC